MAHIQQGDDRQYLSKGIAEVDNSGQYAGIINQGVNSAVSIIQKANESTLANNQIDLSTKFLEKNNEINLKYQADPNNPQREIEIQEAFDSLANQYKINPVCQKQWSDIKNQVYGRYKVYNGQWALKQQQENISSNLKNGYESLMNQISMLGKNGASIDEMRLIYANGIDGLRAGAIAGLGEVVVDDFLKDSNHDIMTTYISALAQDNPLEAQRLLKDEGVRNDIGRAETLEKLDSYVQNSLLNYNKKVAVSELGDTLRALNSDVSDRIISGKADLKEVMKFVESHKNLPQGSVDMINGIYGIRTKSDDVYNATKKKYEKTGSGSGSGGGGVGNIKITPVQKKYMAEELEQELHNLIDFDDAGQLDVKNVKKGKTNAQASDALIGYMNKVAAMQGRIDEAYSVGAIDKPTRQRMMNDYIKPVSDYIESKVGQMDEKWSWGGLAGNKLGYDKVKKAFNTEGLKGEELREMQRQKLFAQNYYLDELNKASKQLGMNNIYDIENLNSHQQKEIYKRASENAIKRAERWTDKPELFFAKEYPNTYLMPSLYFKANQAKAINHIVAEAVFKRKYENEDGTSKIDLAEYANIKCKEEIQKAFRQNQVKAGSILDLRFPNESSITRPYPKNKEEFYSRIKALGLTPEEFMRDARARGFVQYNIGSPASLKYKTPQQLEEMEMKGFYVALQQLEYAKSLQDAKKRGK